MRHGVRHWRIGDWIDAFELVSGPEAGFLHCHATFNIGAMIDGHAHVSVDGASYDQLPGSVVMLNAYQPHASGWSAPSNTYFVLHVGHRFWDEGVAAEGPAWGFAVPVNQDQLVFHDLLGLRAKIRDAESQLASLQASHTRAMTPGAKDVASAGAIAEMLEQQSAQRRHRSRGPTMSGICTVARRMPAFASAMAPA